MRASSMTTWWVLVSSICISDYCFLYALDIIETPPTRTPNKLSSFNGVSNFVSEVQHVSSVECSPSGIALSVSKKETWNHDLLHLSRSFQTFISRSCKVWSKWSKNRNAGDWRYRSVNGDHVDWFCINNWRICNCCVASSLPGESVVESILKWDYLIGGDVRTIWHGYHISRS